MIGTIPEISPEDSVLTAERLASIESGAHMRLDPDPAVFNAWASSKLGEVSAYGNTAPAVERALMPAKARKALEERDAVLAAEQKEIEYQANRGELDKLELWASRLD